jgi:putative PIN family toxin of toxin-antitoxin system
VITINANIYVSALLLEHDLEGQVQVAVSEAILTEVERTLHETFDWSAGELRATRVLILALSAVIDPKQEITVVPCDPDDHRIIECALASGSSCIVTGDKELLRMGEYAEIKMIKVSDFLQRGVEL